MPDRDPPDGYPPIGDYALIGDCRSGALVSKGGSIDWLCWPQFASPSFFAALLDRERGGRFAVRPVGEHEVSRRYVEETAVLETTFRTGTGTLRLTDCFPVASEAAKAGLLWPEHLILRRAECTAGEVEVEVVCDPRPRYGLEEPRLEDRGALGFWYVAGREALALRSEVPLGARDGSWGGRPGVSGRERLRAGEERWLSLAYTDEDPAVVPAHGEEARRTLQGTLDWWSAWAAGCRYEGPHREAVVRSAITLKLLTYAPSGAVIAALTTSLPEKIGGVRNWDYRYCWLRDASITLTSFLDLDRQAEATAFFSWILHSTRLTQPELQVLYDVHGETRLPERELDHLEGYRGSRPVRVGNDARGQLQLDVYGEVADAAIRYVRRGGALSRAAGRMLAGLGDVVCRRWREPDEGIWEIRSGRFHHTFSKALCWTTLDRLLELHDRDDLRLSERQRVRFTRERSAIRAAVEEEGYDEELGSYVSVFGGREVDASLLLLGRFGYADPAGERMLGTCRRVQERLGVNGFLYRYLGYEDGLPRGEGAFGIASFWQADCWCRQGRVDEAEAIFERVLGAANDLGLFGEEIDPETGACLGNFPQAYTHAGLIDAALTLQAARGGTAPAEPVEDERAEVEP
ncbi:MAG TPA: glycoside hydrolase family 15 protein [Thermoanaerobaculia bacterium]|nr:glycoside hydrolase family 15 protein [Thermoanaerobaculia bacterium]